MPPGERQTAQSISLQGRAGEVAALPAPREARHGTALQPPAVVSGTQQGLSKPQVEDSKGRTKQGARGDNALLLHPCSSPHPTCLSLFLSPTTLSHHIWHRGKKMSGEEKHLKQTSSCPACDAVFLSERRGDGSSKDWGNKNSLTKPLLCHCTCGMPASGRSEGRMARCFVIAWPRLLASQMNITFSDTQNQCCPISQNL